MLGPEFKALCLSQYRGGHDLPIQYRTQTTVFFLVSIFFSVQLMIWEWTHFSYSLSFFVVVKVNRPFYTEFKKHAYLKGLVQ